MFIAPNICLCVNRPWSLQLGVDRHILFISHPSSLFPVPFQAVFIPAESISSLFWKIFLSLEFTGVTNWAVIWENCSQLVSVHHLHYYHCNFTSSLSFRLLSGSGLPVVQIHHSIYSFQGKSFLCSCRPVILMLWYGREEPAYTLFNLLICPLLIQRLDHAFCFGKTDVHKMPPSLSYALEQPEKLTITILPSLPSLFSEWVNDTFCDMSLTNRSLIVCAPEPRWGSEVLFSALLNKLMTSAANPRGFYHLIVSACQLFKGQAAGTSLALCKSVHRVSGARP